MSAAPVIGARVGAGRCAGLLVVDATAGFTDPASPLGCAMEAPVAAIAQLLAAARAAGRPVAFTRVGFGAQVDGAAALFQRKVPALRTLREGTPWTQVDTRIAPRAGELVVRKELASAFAGTRVQEWAIAHGLDTLVVVGASTSGCVRATVVDALQLGLRVLVPHAAVGDRDPDSHATSLRDIDGRYGDVVELEEARKTMAGEQ